MDCSTHQTFRYMVTVDIENSTDGNLSNWKRCTTRKGKEGEEYLPMGVIRHICEIFGLADNQA